MPQETPHTKSNMLLINATTWVVFKSFSWTNNQSQKSTFWCSHLYKIVKQENVILTIESWSLMAWAQEWVLGLIPKQKNIIFWEGRRTGILHLVGSSWMSVYNSQKSLNYALKMGTKAVLTTGDQIKHEEWLLFQIPRESFLKRHWSAPLIIPRSCWRVLLRVKWKAGKIQVSCWPHTEVLGEVQISSYLNFTFLSLPCTLKQNHVRTPLCRSL